MSHSLTLDQVNQLIRSRRSIFPRQLSDAPVSREEIETLLENANWAPNHGLTQPWLFIVFSGQGLEDFAQKQADLYKALTPTEQFNPNKYQKLIDKARKCSHLIAICMKGGQNPKIPEIEEIEAVACAVQNLWLTASAMGLGGYWSTGGMTYKPEMADLLGLESGARCLGFFYLGRTDAKVEGRRPVNWQERVRWVE